jgi:hypothetical protein
VRFTLSEGAKSFSEIQERIEKSHKERVPFTYYSAGEAKRFTTSPLPEFTPDDVNEGWVLQCSLHINYRNEASWNRAVHTLGEYANGERGYSLESKSDKVTILHIYRPLDGANEAQSQEGEEMQT